MVGTFDFFSNFRKINEYIRLIGWELKVIESQQAALLPDLIPFWQFLFVAINRCPAHFIAFVQNNRGWKSTKTLLKMKSTQNCVYLTIFRWKYCNRKLISYISMKGLWTKVAGGRILIFFKVEPHIHFSYSRPCCYATRSICFSKRTRRNIYLVSGCANIECISAVLLEFVGGSIQRVVS